MKRSKSSLIKESVGPRHSIEDLAIEDIQRAADVLLPIYEKQPRVPPPIMLAAGRICGRRHRHSCL